jgi:hypothetical protein
MRDEARPLAKMTIASTMPVKLVRWFEMAGIFLGAPLLLLGDFIPRHEILALLAVCNACLVLLLRDKTFDRSRF